MFSRNKDPQHEESNVRTPHVAYHFICQDSDSLHSQSIGLVSDTSSAVPTVLNTGSEFPKCHSQECPVMDNSSSSSPSTNNPQEFGKPLDSVNLPATNDSGLHNKPSTTLAQLACGNLSTYPLTGETTTNGQTGIGQYPFVNRNLLNRPMKHAVQFPLEQPHSRVQCPIVQADTYMLGRSPYVSQYPISKSGGVAEGQSQCTSAPSRNFPSQKSSLTNGERNKPSSNVTGTSPTSLHKPHGNAVDRQVPADAGAA